MSPYVNTVLAVVGIGIGSLALLIGMISIYQMRTDTSGIGNAPNFSESEVIEIARESKLSATRWCWSEHGGNPTASASFKNNGLWVVTAQGQKTCTFLVYDATGKVSEP